MNSTCTLCGSPALSLFSSVECSNSTCRFYRAQITNQNAPKRVDTYPSLFCQVYRHELDWIEENFRRINVKNPKGTFDFYLEYTLDVVKPIAVIDFLFERKVRWIAGVKNSLINPFNGVVNSSWRSINAPGTYSKSPTKALTQLLYHYPSLLVKS